MTTLYAIGDIHGVPAALLDRLAAIHRHAEMSGIRHPPVIFLGDYIDRGPDSKGVLDILTGPEMDRITPTFLAGNHDLELTFICEGGLPDWEWVNRYGGQACLDSYGFAETRNWATAIKGFRKLIPASHKRFLAELKAHTFHREGNWFFSHAGINPSRSLDQQDASSLLRGDSMLMEYDHEELGQQLRDRLGARLMHGHFVETSGIQSWPHRVGIDTGCGYRNGRLTAVAINGDDVEVLP
jgi:serine/threonine protein phosphatase 1